MSRPLSIPTAAAIIIIISHRTYLTNHIGSISHHITPLVINSLGGGHTHANTHMHTFVDRSNSKKPGAGRSAPGLKTVRVLRSLKKLKNKAILNLKTILYTLLCGL